MVLKKVSNDKGPQLVYSNNSGVNILEIGGLKFKDHNRSGKLEDFEDWRLKPAQRAQDLAKRLSIRDIAGLMLFTSHLALPSVGDRGQLYDGEEFDATKHSPSDLSDIQKKYFLKNRIKHTLVAKVQSPRVAAEWNNRVQELSESMPWAIPVVNSSDPRHGYKANAEFNEGSGGQISQWPESIGMGATFDPSLVKKFGEVASKEYRAMGLTMVLGPQVDLATEPRWMRFNGTFGESAKLTSDLGTAFVEGFQDSNQTGEWGVNSVITMAKHWPGGGVIEGGRDAHFGYGKYGVYPKNNQSYQLKSFEAAIDQKSTDVQRTAGIMPYYSISYNFDSKHENVGNSYSRYLITDLLREHYGYDEVVSTDWCITADEPTNVLDILSGDQCWGVEDNYSIGERHLRLLMAGVDQFGGNKDPEPVIWAYDEMCKLMGKPWAEKRFRLSARRILTNMFRLGLFENPYVDIEKANQIVGSKEFSHAGVDAQTKSVVMVKNKNKVLPLTGRVKVYIPKRYYPEQLGWYLNKIPSHTAYSLDVENTSKFFQIVTDPDDADIALVRINSPERGYVKYNGYDPNRVSDTDNGYLPISLQYLPYEAKLARKVSIAGDRRDGQVLNRSYFGKSIDTINQSDLEQVRAVRNRMGNKPVILSIDTSNPFVISEIEPYVDAILLDFGVDSQVIYSLITGASEPSGLLPFQMPKNMDTVETQNEDTPFDMMTFMDEEGNSYDFGYGLNFSGRITDWRTTKYTKDVY